jgi:hypothetical protein
MRVCIDILKQHPGESLVFFVEKRAVRLAILKDAPVEIRHVEDVGESMRNALKDLKKFIMHKGWFLLENIYRIIISRYACRMQRHVKPQTTSILIHTWIDQRSFDSEGRYHESYFGDLPDYLRKSGEKVAIIPYIATTIPYGKPWMLWQNPNTCFWCPTHSFQFLMFLIFFSPLWQTRPQA